MEIQDCRGEPCAMCTRNCLRIHGGRSSNGSSYFFKIMLGNFSEKLRIPPAFVGTLRNQSNGNVILEGPSSQRWSIKLCKTSIGMEFQKGWEKFVCDHRLELGDFLVFKYTGKSYFTVQIFGRSGCEKRNVFNMKNFGASLLSLEEKADAQDNCPDTLVKSFDADSYQAVPKRTNSQMPITLYADEDSNEQAMGTSKFKQSVAETCPNSAKHPYQGITARTIKNTESYQPSFSEKKHEIVTSAEPGRKSYVQAYYVSCRRPVTQAERNKALKDARSFKSTKPLALIVMKPSHVYQGFWLALPKRLDSCFQLPKGRYQVTLLGPANKEWTVQYIGDCGRAGLSGGWKHFSVDNNLEEGDVCIFELVNKKKYIFKVHIFRVIKNYTPYKRMEGTRVNENNGRGRKRIALPSLSLGENANCGVQNKCPDTPVDSSDADQNQIVAKCTDSKLLISLDSDEELDDQAMVTRKLEQSVAETSLNQANPGCCGLAACTIKNARKRCKIVTYAENEGKKRKIVTSAENKEKKGEIVIFADSKGKKYRIATSAKNEGKKKRKIVTSAENEGKSYLGAYFVSCRRAVTLAERKKAFNAANAFKSSKPFSLLIMKPSHVYQGFYLSFPKRFEACFPLPQERMHLTLLGPTNKEWQVQYLGNNLRPGLSGGWRYFSLENNIEEGDVCVFELVNAIKYCFKVHIFRVVKKCTPFKKMEGTKINDKDGQCRKIIADPVNHFKKRKVSRMSTKKIGTISAVQASRSHIPDILEQGIVPKKEEKQVQNKKDHSSSPNKFVEMAKSSWDSREDRRTSPRFNKVYNSSEHPKKQFSGPAFANRKQTIDTDTMLLSAKTNALLDDTNGEADLIIIWDSNDVAGPSNIIPSQESIHERPVLTKSKVQVVKQENQK